MVVGGLAFPVVVPWLGLFVCELAVLPCIAGFSTVYLFRRLALLIYRRAFGLLSKKKKLFLWSNLANQI